MIKCVMVSVSSMATTMYILLQSPLQYILKTSNKTIAFTIHASKEKMWTTSKIHMFHKIGHKVGQLHYTSATRTYMVKFSKIKITRTCYVILRDPLNIEFPNISEAEGRLRGSGSIMTCKLITKNSSSKPNQTSNCNIQHVQDLNKEHHLKHSTFKISYALQHQLTWPEFKCHNDKMTRQ